MHLFLRFCVILMSSQMIEAASDPGNLGESVIVAKESDFYRYVIDHIKYSLVDSPSWESAQDIAIIDDPVMVVTEIWKDTTTVVKFSYTAKKLRSCNSEPNGRCKFQMTDWIRSCSIELRKAACNELYVIEEHCLKVFQGVYASEELGGPSPLDKERTYYQEALGLMKSILSKSFIHDTICITTTLVITHDVAEIVNDTNLEVVLKATLTSSCNVATRYKCYCNPPLTVPVNYACQAVIVKKPDGSLEFKGVKQHCIKTGGTTSPEEHTKTEAGNSTYHPHFLQTVREDTEDKMRSADACITTTAAITGDTVMDISVDRCYLGHVYKISYTTKVYFSCNYGCSCDNNKMDDVKYSCSAEIWLNYSGLGYNKKPVCTLL